MDRVQLKYFICFAITYWNVFFFKLIHLKNRSQYLVDIDMIHESVSNGWIASLVHLKSKSLDVEVVKIIASVKNILMSRDLKE